MELVSAYRERYDLRLLLFLAPFGLYFYVFSDFLLGLFAGSFIFTYFVLALVLVNRYLLELLKVPYFRIRHWEYFVKLRSLNPEIATREQVRFLDVVTIELMPFVALQVFYVGLYGLLIQVLGSNYLSNVCLGVLMINWIILYRNACYVLHGLRYRNRGVYTYKRRELWVYAQKQ